MRPDTAGKNSFLFFFFGIVASLQGYWRCRHSSFIGMDDGDDGVAPWQTAVVPVVVLVVEGGCIFMHSSKIKMNILFDLIPAWLGGYKKSIFKHASNAPPARHNKVLGELQLSAADFENSIHTHNHEWVGD